MKRTIDPCYCNQACEYEALLSCVASSHDVPQRIRAEIERTINKYKAALDAEEDSDLCCHYPEEHEYQPPNERDEGVSNE